MLRVRAFALAGAAAVGLPLVPAAALPVKALEAPATAQVCPVAPCDGVVPNRPPARSAVVGYIMINHRPTTHQDEAQPRYSLYGALADPNLWRCSSSTLLDGRYKVNCLPQPNVVLDWQCNVLHADVTTYIQTARARATLDCDGYQTPHEAQTAVVVGAGGRDSVWAQSNVVVSEFSCIVDGASQPQRPDYTVGCGDPGLVTLNWI